MTATYQAFSGRTGPRSGVPGSELQGWSVAQMARQVRADAGSQRAAAAALGVNVATFRRWEAGQTKAPKGAASLKQAAVSAWRRARMTPAREARLRGKPPWSLAGEVEFSNDVRARTIQPGRSLPAGNLNDALDAYLRGDDVAAAAEMEDLVRRYAATGGVRAGVSVAVRDVDPGGIKLAGTPKRKR